MYSNLIESLARRLPFLVRRGCLRMRSRRQSSVTVVGRAI